MSTLFPDHAPRARTSDPATSHAAAASVTGLTEKQMAVIRVLERLGGDGTDASIANAYTVAHGKYRSLYPLQSPSGLRTRRSELTDAGLIVDSGRRAELPTGRKAIVWQLAPGVQSQGVAR